MDRSRVVARHHVPGGRLPAAGEWEWRLETRRFHPTAEGWAEGEARFWTPRDKPSAVARRLFGEAGPDSLAGE